MSQGYFFRSDERQIAGCFSWTYARIVKKMKENLSDDHPISVLLFKTRVDFIFHGYPYAEKQVAPLTNSDDSNINNRESYIYNYYTSGRIFSLPLNNDTSNELNNTLSNFEILKSGYPFHDFIPLVDSNIYCKVPLEGDQKLKSGIRTSAYFEAVNFFFSSTTRETKQLYLPELLLDFFFDFFHSNAFHASPNFLSLRSYLLSHPFTKGIIAKLNYYYYRNLLDLNKNEATNIQDDNQRKWQLAEEERKYFDKKGAEALEDWHSILQNPEYEKIINPKNKWFDDIESEVNKLFQDSQVFRETIQKKSEQIIQWKLNRYDLIGAFSLQFRKVFGLFSIIAIIVTPFVLIVLFFHKKNIIYLLTQFDSSPEFFLLTTLSFFLLWLVVGVFLERSILVAGGLILWIFCWIYHPIKYKGFIGLRKTKEYFANCITQGRRNLLSISHIFLSLPKLIRFFQPQVLLLSGVVWAVVITNEQFWLSLDFKFWNTFSIILWGGLIIGAAIFLSVYCDSLLPIENKLKKARKILKRVAIFFLIGSVYSFIIGGIGMSHAINKSLLKDYDLESYFLTEKVAKRIDFKSITDSLKVRKLLSEDLISSGSDNNVPEKLFHQVLPYLYHDEKFERKVFLTSKTSLFPGTFLQTPFKVQVLQDMLIFYTFVCLSLGVILEVAWNKKDNQFLSADKP